MPAKSQAQQMAAGAALSAKRGQRKKNERGSQKHGRQHDRTGAAGAGGDQAWQETVSRGQTLSELVVERFLRET